jgi:HK97 family phage major capsid protein
MELKDLTSKIERAADVLEKAATDATKSVSELRERVETLEAQTDRPRISGGDNSRELKTLFGKHLQALHAGDTAGIEVSFKALHEYKAMSGASAAAGGNLLPEILSDEITRKLRISSPLYADARITRVTT